MIYINIKEITEIMSLDQWLNILGIVVSVAIAIITYRISHSLSAKNIYDHEVYISEQLRPFLGRKIILSDVKKYSADNDNEANEDYCKQACCLEEIVPVYGVVVSLRDKNGFKRGMIPFNWIEYVRPYDSEDSAGIVVCKFIGIKWFKNYKSPIKNIE